MARYNTTVGFALSSGAVTVSSPDTGRLVTLTGTAPYTVTLPSPDQFIGTPQTFFNSSTGVVTFSTPAGSFQGPGSTGTATQTVPLGATVTFIPNGSNYLITSSINMFVDTLVTSNATFNLINTGAGTVNAFGQASSLNLGANTGTLTIGNPTVVGTQTSVSLWNTVSTTVDAFQAAETITMGGNTATSAVVIRSTKPATSVSSGALVVNGGIAANGVIHCTSIVAGGSQLTTVGKAIAMALVFGG